MIAKILIVAVGGVLFMTAIALLISLPVMLLWNALLPALFGFKTITWLQALGLCVLCHILFKSSGSTSSK